MMLTITAKSNIANDVMLTGIDSDLVTIKEKTKRNGFQVVEVKIQNGKRSVCFANGVYCSITVQDEETGRFLLKYER